MTSPAVALRAGPHGRGCRARRQRRADADGTGLAAAGIRPVELREKEGLALINGTDGMLGQLVLAITDLRRLLAVADITAAMSVEGQLGTDDVFAADLQELRPSPARRAPRRTCGNCCRTVRFASHHGGLHASRTPTPCAARPGCRAVRDTVSYAAQVAGFELASAVDNPVVTKDGRVESNGNFHGAPVAYVLDFLAIVAADLASISSAARTASSTWPAATGSTPSSRTTRESTPGT